MNRAETLYREGTTLMHTDRAIAARLLRESVALEPDRPSAIYNLVVVLVAMGESQEALTRLQRLEEIARDVATPLRAELADAAPIYIDHAMHLLGEGELSEAMKKCETGLAFDSSLADGWVVKAMIHRERGETDECFRCHDAAISLDEDNYVAWLNRGFDHAKVGRLSEAEADYTRAIELDPHDAEAYRWRAELYEVLGETQKAATDRATAERLGRPPARSPAKGLDDSRNDLARGSEPGR